MTLLEESAELSFHGEDYSIYSGVNEQLLSVEVEQKASGRRWSADFTSKYIEEMSQKTGNFKKFSVFVNMLWSALKGNTESVFVDLLTLQDLETLRSRRTPSTVPARPLKASSENKRYLILTYAVEFDRVHYPLPLRYEEHPDAKSLQRTIMRLRRELDQCRLDSVVEGTPDDHKRLRELEDENCSLRNELHNLEADYNDRNVQQRQRDRDVESLQHQLNERDVELRRLREKLAKQNLENLKLKKELREMVVQTPTPKQQQQKRIRPRTSSRSGTSTTSTASASGRTTAPRRQAKGSPARVATHRLGRSRSPRVIASSKVASPRARFDPTAYVACKRKTEAARRLRTRSSSWGRAPSPLGSQQRSSSSSSRSRRRSQRRSTSASSPSSPSTTSRASRTARPQQQKITTPKRLSSNDDGNDRRRKERDTSEGEAKLLRRAKELSRNHTALMAAPLRRTSSGSLMEIRDLDERLTALQQFLKAAKGKSAKIV